MQSHRAWDRMGAQGNGKDFCGFVLQCINHTGEGKRQVGEAGWDKIMKSTLLHIFQVLWWLKGRTFINYGNLVKLFSHLYCEE